MDTIFLVFLWVCVLAYFAFVDDETKKAHLVIVWAMLALGAVLTPVFYLFP